MKTATRRLLNFIRERHAIYLKRQRGLPKPWTKDPIFLEYKFCNVYRELDRVTLWLAENWRTPHAGNPDIWFWMAVARLLNRISSLEMLRVKNKWEAQDYITLVHGLKARGVPAFGSAYMLSTHGHKADKAEFIANRILTPLWEDRKKLRPREGDSLEDFYAQLSAYFGMGKFIAAQVVADTKYVQPLMLASDWWTFAASGPGSRRGMNRMFGREINKGWNEAAWHSNLIELQDNITPFVRNIGYPALHAQDLQNCLCEFDKYERIRLNEGRMKMKYNGRN